ncbi:RNA polymerase sigma-70 factor (ECF subfamily) [Paenibacillus cellulosilyticus]|uniref:RNA polymerase sigma-70 factor (ECF subfamily) n=1 Tax=Paenibacillus cellulosilyticus TaxID=375489 RepID=A0A2V2YVJ5_9BACL|nr:sigma-70 family RNA polymerase sigma factor [Paenibacillus cellulosilyticus]PWW05119.1 RNA polymerase sigma-70 factor (ECF subfamily) [Paenibacillus cellulosilyticus]QKS48668.1 sigma-70 family RNA polymerase sigma factor [Paenibacillus cellulosilyticus]
MTMAAEGEFEKLTTPFRVELLRYCRKLTGTEWDGEDLYQEVMLKAFRRYQRWPERELTKPYLYRMAANAWFDICRRRRIAFYPELLEEQLSIPYEEWSRFDVRESLELLMDRLEPRQVVLVLLTDVFGFSPTEAGQALGQPITAIKAALHRARSRLKKAADRQLHRFEEEDFAAAPSAADTDSKAHAALFESFVTAFREADADSLFQTYRALTVNRSAVERVVLLRGQAWFYFKDPDGNLLMLTTPYTRQSM